ncbi:MAG: DUF1559 domain-containing protein, partial [Planctomycetales bacterium]|nr:DUF1559 domain-containing protein [Planctomycetales bacterium]
VPEGPDAASKWTREAPGPVIAWADVATLRGMIGRSWEAGPIGAMLLPAIEGSESVTLEFRDVDPFEIRISVRCRNAEIATLVRSTLEAVVRLSANALTIASQRQEAPPNADVEEAEFMLMGSQLINAAKLERNETTVRLTAQITDFEQATAKLVPVLRGAMGERKERQQINRLKSIGLALHMYYDANGHFPPAVLQDEATGTPYSWRVAILPYMDQQALFERYRFDQPWDSPSNREVLKDAPSEYCATAPAQDGSTEVLAIAGTNTVISTKTPTKFVQIVDGTSNTVMLVAAGRRVPWTKPEDIAYDSDAPLPAIAPEGANELVATYCDGSVRPVPLPADEKTLRSLFQINDQYRGDGFGGMGLDAEMRMEGGGAMEGVMGRENDEESEGVMGREGSEDFPQ